MKPANHYKPWTKKDELDLIEFAGVLPIERITKKLNRTRDSIESKAKELKINLKPEYDNFSGEQLAKILKCRRGSIDYWIKRGNLKCKRITPGKKFSRRRISCNAIKKLYNEKPNLKIWQNADQETLNWVMGN